MDKNAATARHSPQGIENNATGLRRSRSEERKASEDSSGSGNGGAEDGELRRDGEGSHGAAAEVVNRAFCFFAQAVW